MILEPFDIFDIKFLLYNKDRYKFYRSFQQLHISLQRNIGYDFKIMIT